MKKTWLSLVMIVLIFQAHAQTTSDDNRRNEYVTGAILFWENNTSTVGIGLQQMYRRTLSDRFNLLAGLSAIQGIPDWRIDAGYSSHSVLLAELGVQVSPFRPGGHWKIGVAGGYRYGSDLYSFTATDINLNTGEVRYYEKYEGDFIRQAGYSFNISYQAELTERFTTHTTLQMHNFNYFGEMFTLGFQVGYRF